MYAIFLRERLKIIPEILPHIPIYNDKYGIVGYLENTRRGLVLETDTGDLLQLSALYIEGLYKEFILETIEDKKYVYINIHTYLRSVQKSNGKLEWVQALLDRFKTDNLALLIDLDKVRDKFFYLQSSCSGLALKQGLFSLKTIKWEYTLEMVKRSEYEYERDERENYIIWKNSTSEIILVIYQDLFQQKFLNESQAEVFNKICLIYSEIITNSTKDLFCYRKYSMLNILMFDLVNNILCNLNSPTCYKDKALDKCLKAFRGLLELQRRESLKGIKHNILKKESFSTGKSDYLDKVQYIIEVIRQQL